MRGTITSWNFVLFVFFCFYSLGVGLLESLLNYPSWYLIGPTDAWAPYRQLLTARIIPLLAIPALLFQLVTNIVVIINRPSFVPRWSAWTTLILLLILVISSVTIQIPMQMQFNDAYDVALLSRLIE
ncbi:MAG: hypothetical protein H7Y31_09275 [Chitinophagaceae bacterium]|nr:hypothetical protein [Chitinophagaceae bacterium]